MKNTKDTIAALKALALNFGGDAKGDTLHVAAMIEMKWSLERINSYIEMQFESTCNGQMDDAQKACRDLIDGWLGYAS